AQSEHLLGLDIGLPLNDMRQQLRATLGGKSDREEIVVQATDQRGKPFQCRVTFLPLGAAGNGEVSGVIMMMEDVDA
ncbi:MAG TPA: hypothetical protein VGH93_06910, partial [Solirubrobacteraceae bacterium]